MTTGGAAKLYAAHGWPVFPVWHAVDQDTCGCRQGKACANPAKHPMNRHGLLAATTDVALLEAVWREHPQANVGVRTGVAFDVLDVDSTAAGIALAERINATTPDVWQYGPMSMTARGSHLLYAPTGQGNRAALAGIIGVDWRGANGYVIAPPSVHASGHVYRWHQDCPFDAPIPPAPSELVELLTERESKPLGAQLCALPTNGRWNPDGLIRKVATAPEGTRNDALNWAAYRMGQDFKHGRMPLCELEQAVEALACAAINSRLTAREVDRTIVSGLSQGGA